MPIARPTAGPARTPEDRRADSPGDSPQGPSGHPVEAGTASDRRTPPLGLGHPTRRPSGRRVSSSRSGSIGQRRPPPGREGLGPFRLDLLEALAHEIRTPMTTIYGAMKMLGRSGPSLSTAERTEMLGGVELEADRLYRLLEDFFAVAGIADPVGSAPEPVLVQHVLRDVIGDLVPTLEGRRIHAVLPAGVPPVRGDVDSLGHAAHNLIENAVEASPPCGLVEVVIRPGRSSVAVHVYDRGPHPEPGGARAFEPFEGAAGERTIGPGRALALAASRALVEAMGGRTWATTRPDGGTETGFALPLYSRDPAPRTRRRHEARGRAFPRRGHPRRRSGGPAGSPPSRQAG